MDEFGSLELSAKAERNRKKIQSMIISCVNCQPFDEGEPVWIHGVKRELIELFEDNKIPEKEWDAIASNLICPNCGPESFEIYSDVGVKSKFDIVLDKYMDQTLKKHGPVIKEFDSLLEKVPLLAYSHKFGKKIYSDLENLNFPVTSLTGTFYRAREAKNSEILSKEKLMNPPTGKPGEGRYNHSGQSHLYLSSDFETAIEEVIGLDEDKIVWILELDIETIDNILDLSFDWTLTSPETSPIYFTLCGQNFINRSDRNNELWKPDYFITRYIADCAKHLGYNGIKYNSAKKFSIENIVLFYPENCDIKAINEPQLHLYRKKEIVKREILDI